MESCWSSTLPIDSRSRHSGFGSRRSTSTAVLDIGMQQKESISWSSEISLIRWKNERLTTTRRTNMVQCSIHAAKSQKIDYVEVSALSASNISDAFEVLARSVLKRLTDLPFEKKKVPQQTTTSKIAANNASNKSNTGGCCWVERCNWRWISFRKQSLQLVPSLSGTVVPAIQRIVRGFCRPQRLLLAFCYFWSWSFDYTALLTLVKPFWPR